MADRSRTTSLALRAATRADVPSLVSLERACFSDPWPRASFESMLQSHTAELTVCESVGEVVGYSAVIHVLDEAELANIAVAESVRRQGVGRLLMSSLLQQAKDRGVQRMFLEVRESNGGAKGLYESEGFVCVARRRAYYRDPDEDALVMRWDAAHSGPDGTIE